MKLYIVHVGFYDNSIGIYEMHSNMLIAATDVKSAKQIVKAKEIFINKMMHIDGIEEINNVDGYDIILAKNSGVEISNKVFSHSEIKAL